MTAVWTSFSVSLPVTAVWTSFALNLSVTAVWTSLICPQSSCDSCLDQFCCQSSCDSCLDRLVAACTALMRAALSPSCSNWWTPAMVVPPAEQTASFNMPGCWPVSSTILAAPWGKKEEPLLGSLSCVWEWI